MLIKLSEAQALLIEGEILAVPTETVYGLAALARLPKAIEKIYLTKGRSKKNPLIVHISNISQIEEFVSHIPSDFLTLCASFWPGPMTFLLPAKDSVSSLITAGLPTVAVRMPRHASTLALIEKVGPIVAPSANLSGKPSSTLVEHVTDDFGSSFPILEGPSPDLGVESTIIGFVDHGWKILRHGVISQESIEEVLCEKMEESDLAICPGKMLKHYSPNAELFSNPDDLSKAEVIIGFENRTYPSPLPLYSLGIDSNPEMIAKNLFTILRSLDSHKIKNAWIDLDLPHERLYRTILERLSRAMEKEKI